MPKKVLSSRARLRSRIWSASCRPCVSPIRTCCVQYARSSGVLGRAAAVGRSLEGFVLSPTNRSSRHEGGVVTNAARAHQCRETIDHVELVRARLQGGDELSGAFGQAQMAA